MELVSAIITTHNRLDLLKKAIASVFWQTYRRIDLIIVSDNSGKETENYLRLLKETHTPFPVIIKLISKEESRGGNYARNCRIKLSHGRYVAFLDDDDEWLDTKIEKQVNLLDEENKVGFVYCGKIVERDFKSREASVPDPEYRGNLSRKIFTKIFCSTSMIMVRRDLLVDVGLFDEEVGFWQEYDLCIRLC